MKNKILYLAIITLSFCFMTNAKAVYTDALVGSYENELSKFPCEYQNKIKELHNTYPNAVFVAQKEFLDWNKYKEVPVKWNDMLAAEDKKNRSLIYYTAPSSYRTSTCAQKNNSGTCTWYVATQAGISYYMNPYNFLDFKHVFMFESQLYNPNQTETGVEKLLSGTFMSNKNCPGSNKTYAQVIIESAQAHSLSAYMLAARLKQEQGVNGTSSLISGNYKGYEGYYNYFNVKASGSTDAEIIKNGLQYAKENNWTSPYLAIKGGAKFLRTTYIGVNDTYNVKGQMTNYLQKWDPYGPIYGGKQYMQNIAAPYTEAEMTYNAYTKTSDYTQLRYVFYIPIFEGAPNTSNNGCTVNNQSTTNTNNQVNTSNSYKINGNYISGINQGTTANTVAANTKGTVTSSSGTAKTTAKIATGDKVKIGNTTYTVVIYGDVNGDGEISAVDYVKVKNQIIKGNSISGIALQGADVNKDGKVTAVDYVKIKNHILGASKIAQ